MKTGTGSYYRGAWRWYFYDGLNVLAEGTGTGDRAFNTMAGGGPGGIVCRDDNGTKLWYHCDRLGNVMCVSDDDGNAEELYTMDAFGNLLEIGDGFLRKLEALPGRRMHPLPVARPRKEPDNR